MSVLARAHAKLSRLARLGLALLLGVGAGYWPAETMAAASDWDRTDVSAVRLIAATDGVGESRTVRLGLQFRLDPGWKIYWRSPGDAGLPPQPDFSASDNIAQTAMHWPAPQRFLEAGDLETIGYLGETVFPLDVTLARPGEPMRVRAVVDYQACEKICIPYVADLALDLPAGPAGPTEYTQVIDQAEARVPGPPPAAGIEIRDVALDGAVPDQTLRVTAHSVTPFTAPDLIVEGGDMFRFTKAEADLAPDRLTVSLKVPVESYSGDSAAGETVTLTLVDSGLAAEFETTLGTGGTPAASPSAAAGPSQMQAAGTAGTVAGIDLVVILLLAMVGGLILNLMPCVLPVLSLKVMGVISHGGGERGRVTRSFLATAAGIVASFLVLALALIGLKAGGHAVGWGIQFQQPLFLVFLTVVVSLFAYNLFGLFEIRLPGGVGDWAGRPDAGKTRSGSRGGSLSGAFWTGAFATLLATPCSAPFLGTAVGFALSRGAGEIALVFAALGLGMAIPYLLVAAVPGLATRLPKPGPWMLWVRRIMGLALAATAVWLLTIIAVQSGPWAAAIVAALMLAIGAVLAALASRRGRLAAGAVTALTLVAFVMPALLGGGPEAGADGHAPGAGDATVTEAVWQAFDPGAIPELVAAGKTVFVDVTADWCVTCKVNKTLVLDSDVVRQRLADDGVIAMRADWTRPDPVITDYLAGFGRYGIPFNAVYGPGTPTGTPLSELLSRDAVLAALDQAKP